MLPESKIKAHLNGRRDDALLVTNLRSNEVFRPQALSDYEKKKEEQKKAIHAEIKRVSLETIDV